MSYMDQRLYEHPELGITPEMINGRSRYRHKTTPEAIGVWISGATVKKICGMIPPRSTTVEAGVAEAVVKAVEKYNLGEERLKTAQRAHYDAFLSGGSNNMLPQWAARESRELAIRYNLGDEAIQRAELAVYSTLMGDRHQLRPHVALKEAIEAAYEFFIRPVEDRLASLQQR